MIRHLHLIDHVRRGLRASDYALIVAFGLLLADILPGRNEERLDLGRVDFSARAKPAEAGDGRLAMSALHPMNRHMFLQSGRR